MRTAALGFTILAVAAIAQTTRTVWDGVYSDEQANRGKAAYADDCASCHGAELTGGEQAPALAGSEFLGTWNGLTVGVLFDRMKSSMPQNDPGSLSRQVNADILAYILKVNNFPAGKTEMEHESEALKQIKILSEKPK
ncbi:MAG TPA: c-type cytochrome [Bryobacteraceae bacterium]|jgi:mono/diheme cytochrome c family protein